MSICSKLFGGVLLSCAAFSCLSAGEFRSEWSLLKLGGKSLSSGEQGLFYDSAKEPSSRFRSAGATLEKSLGGKIEINAGVSVRQLDHWNSFGLRLSSEMAGLWGVELTVSQEGIGKFFVSAVLKQNGKVTASKKIPMKFSGGTLTIVKDGVKAFCEVTGTGKVTRIAEFNGIPDTSAQLSLFFGTPKATNQKTKINSLSVKWSNDNAAAFLAPWKNTWEKSDAAQNYGCSVEAVFSPGKPDFRLISSKGALRMMDGFLLYETKKTNRNEFRWAGAEYNTPFDGDFMTEGDFDVKQLDHWNNVGLALRSAKDKAWSVDLNRSQEAPGKEFFTVNVKKAGKTVFTQKVPSKERCFTFAVSRKGDKMTFAARLASGKVIPLGEISGMPVTACKAAFTFGTAKGTNGCCCVSGLRIKCAKTVAAAFAPAYGSSVKVGDLRILWSEKAEKDASGTWRIAPGGRLIAGIATDPNTRGCNLRFQSEGLLRIRSIQPGSAESLQLSDSLLYDQPDHRNIPAGFAERSVSLEQHMLRFAVQRQWRFPVISHNGLFFFEIAPAADSAVRISLPAFYASTILPVKPFKAAAKSIAQGKPVNGFTRLNWNVPASAAGFLTGADVVPAAKKMALDDISYAFNPTILSHKCPSFELELNRYAGYLHILHVAGKQPEKGDFSELLAAYMIVYEDGTTQPAFAILRWNCGVYASGDYDKARFLSQGPGQGNASTTWWGPPRFGWGKALYLPRTPYGYCWNALYAFDLRNPHPEKKIRSLIAYQMPGDNREFALCGVTLRDPAHTVTALLEPDRAAFYNGESLGVNCYEYRAVPASSSEENLEMVKSAAAKETLGKIKIQRAGHFGAGRAVINPTSAKLDTGAVTFRAGLSTSSRLALMGDPNPENPFYYMMIAGGREGFGEFDRIKRIGFDAVKVHVGWDLNPDGTPDFSGWPERFARIGRAGLKVAIRNFFAVPQRLRAEIPEYRLWKNGRFEPHRNPRSYPNADPGYCTRLAAYYRTVGELAQNAPNVMGINASYGTCCYLKQQGGLLWSDALRDMFAAYLEKHVILEELNRQTGLGLKQFRDITPEMITGPNSAYLMPLLTRAYEENVSKLIRSVCHAIRSTGCKAHLTFNVNFHHTEQKWHGQTYGEYLRIGRDLPPASLFHETSERYNISFDKFLLAKRTFGLPYGDEVGQPPPTYEHAVLGYMWMGMFQCFESNYCQWWGGKPATQNLVQLKPYHKLLYEAEYLPDPVNLAIALGSGHCDAAKTFRMPVHKLPFAHYSMVNFLRELNIAADRAMVDEFPEKDAELKGKLLIDDHTRHMPKAFGDRIEKFIRNGGTFLAADETDPAFLARFGLKREDGKVSGADRISGKLYPVAEKKAGNGLVVWMQRSWAHAWDPGHPQPDREEMLALLTRLGAFTPHVSSSHASVFVTPYRAKNGDLLISCINVTAAEQSVEVTFDPALLKGTPVVRDLGSGVCLPVTRKNGRCMVKVSVPEINTTVLRISGK